jgi:DNA-directed RNA polymerase subunit L
MLQNLRHVNNDAKANFLRKSSSLFRTLREELSSRSAFVSYKYPHPFPMNRVIRFRSKSGSNSDHFAHMPAQGIPQNTHVRVSFQFTEYLGSSSRGYPRRFWSRFTIFAPSPRNFATQQIIEATIQLCSRYEKTFSEFVRFEVRIMGNE